MKNLIYILLPLAFASVLIGIYGGLIRIGWGFPVWNAVPINHHGVLMMGSFLGGLVAIERVVASKRKWAWLVPVLFVLSMPTLLFGMAREAFLLLGIGALGYLVLQIWFLYKYPEKSNVLLLIGAFFQLIANSVLFISESYPMAVAGWILFIVFTIVGERLEFTKFLPVSKASFIELYVWLALVVTGTALYHPFSPLWLGISMLGLSQWLYRNDIARINIKKRGSYKFLGVALYTAYFWLAFLGLLFLVNPESLYLYDAVMHSFFIGFVLSMILAHAPIIFPGILGIAAKPFHPLMYVWFLVLQLSLAARILGDFKLWTGFRTWGAFFNGFSFLAYMATVGVLIIRSKKAKIHG